MEVWTYYENNSGFGTTSPALNTFITAVAGTFGGVSGGGGEQGAIYNGVDGALTTFGTGGNQGDNGPGAYLNYILFDTDYHVLDMGWTPATGYNSQQKISINDIAIKEPGHIFIYLSYEDESNNYVQFDDFKVTHTKTNIIQYNEYYPFGLQASTSWTRENSKNNFLYNGAAELNNTSGYYDLFFRNYDPTVGRFIQVDPLAHLDNATSPFAYGGNNPVYYNDPMGLLVSASGSRDEYQPGMNYNTWRRTQHNSGEIFIQDWNEDFSENGGGSNYNNGFSGSVVFTVNHEGFSYDVSVDFTDGTADGIAAFNSSMVDEGLGIAFVLDGIWSMSGQGGFLQDGPGDLNPSSSNDFPWLNVGSAQLNIWGGATTIATEGPKPLYTGPKTWVNQKASGAKFGRALGIAGLALTAIDMRVNGVNTSNTLDATFGVISFAGIPGAIIGGVYFGANLITTGITGKTIGQHVDDNFHIIPTGALPGVPFIFIPKKLD